MEYDPTTILRSEFQACFAALESKLLQRFESLEGQFRELKSLSSTTQETNLSIEKSVSYVSEKLTVMEEKIDQLEVNRKTLVKQIVELENKCENIERIMRKSCMEIRSVPKQKDESLNDLFKMILALAKTLGIELEQHDLRDVYRINNKANKDVSTVVFELSNTLIKQQFNDAVKKWNKPGREQLNTSNLGLTDSATPIYVSECLTARAKRLHFLTRDFAKSQNYKYCWTKNGLVYLRVKAGDPYILVKDESQLKELPRSLLKNAEELNVKASDESQETEISPSM